MRLRLICLLLSGALTVAPAAWAGPRSFELKSPDGKNSVAVEVGPRVSWSVTHAGNTVLAPSILGMSLLDGKRLGTATSVKAIKRSTANRVVAAALYAKRSTIRDHYNQLQITLEDGLQVIFRAYDDAVAYRLATSFPGQITIVNEDVELRFPGAPTAYLPIADCAPAKKKGVDCFHNGFEETYTVAPLSALSQTAMAFVPVLIDGGGQTPKLLFTEADLDDYPGLWVRAPRITKQATEQATAPGLTGVFAGYPLEEKVVGTKWPQMGVARRAEYIAVTKGARLFPWRVAVIAAHDKDLADTDIVYRLGGETPRADWSWVKPGKSQSEWLWDNILYDVPFAAGYNTETYRHYINFNARFGLGYMFFDAGWSEVTDLLKLTSAIDVPGLIDEARAKGLGTVLWASSLALNRQMVPAFETFSKWGVKGVMVDFMDRDDQVTVNFYRRVAQEAAKRKMIVNFHGAFKPTGFERRFPNALTRESLVAFEYNKWTEKVTPDYELMLPFIRGVAGPMDYEPGQMRNAQKGAFRVIESQPHSQGTRMHQAAMYLVYESPYAKMGGNVSDYLREPEFTKFLAELPTVYKESKTLDGKVGEFVVTLREAKNGTFYAGAMTGSSARKIELPLNFLPPGVFNAEIHEDGANAARYGADWRRIERTVRSSDCLVIDMAPGGGWVGSFRPKLPISGKATGRQP